MPKGPQGQTRPAGVIGNAVMIARIATGEMKDTARKQPTKRKCGMAGATVRKVNTTDAHRRDIARNAAATRWG